MIAKRWDEGDPGSFIDFSLQYDESLLDGASEDSLILRKYDESLSEWVLIETSTHDKESNKFRSGELTEFGTYAVFLNNFDLESDDTDGTACGTVTQNIVLQNDIVTSGICLTVGASDITIDGNGYSIKSDGKGTAITGEGHNNIVIKNLELIDFKVGISLSNADNIEIRENNIYSSLSAVAGSEYDPLSHTFQPIEPSRGVVLVDITNGNVMNNDFEVYKRAVYVTGSVEKGFSKNIDVTNNNIKTIEGYRRGDGSIGFYNKCTGCQIVGNTIDAESGIYVISDEAVSDLIIKENKITTSEGGISLLPKFSPKVIDNEIIVNKQNTDAPAAGIYLHSNDTLVDNNVIKVITDTTHKYANHKGTGIHISFNPVSSSYSPTYIGPINNVISNNKITSTSIGVFGVYITHGRENTIRDNTIQLLADVYEKGLSIWSIGNDNLFENNRVEVNEGYEIEVDINDRLGGSENNVFLNTIVGDGYKISANKIRGVRIKNIGKNELPENLNLTNIGGYYRLDSSGGYLDMDIHYEDDPDLFDESSINLYYFDNKTQKWLSLSGSSINTELNKINTGYVQFPFNSLHSFYTAAFVPSEGEIIVSEPVIPETNVTIITTESDEIVDQEINNTIVGETEITENVQEEIVTEDNTIPDNQIDETEQPSVDNTEEPPVKGACRPHKTLLCHVVGNEHELCVPQTAARAHLDHGDYRGYCVVEKSETLVLEQIVADTPVTVTPETEQVRKVVFETKKGYDKPTIKIKNRNVPPKEIREIRKPVAQYIVIEHDEIDNKEVTSSKIEFSVNQSWLKEHKKKIEDVVMTKFIDSDWVELDTTYIETIDDVHYFKAESEGLSTFAITFKGEETPVDEWRVILEPDNLLTEIKLLYSRFKTWILPAFVTALFFIFLINRKNKKKEVEIDEVNVKFQNLLDHVAESRREGQSDEQIRKELELAKWDKDTIDKVLSHK